MLTSWPDRLRSWVQAWRDEQRPISYSGHVLLPSDLAEIPFRAHLQMMGYRGHSAMAVYERLRALASEVTAGYSVLHWQEAECAVKVMLGSGPVLREGPLAGAIVSVSLRVDPGATEAAAEHAKLRRSSVLVREGHRLQQEQWSYLRDDVLGDPGSTRLWWLDGNRDRLKELVAMGSAFECAAELFSATPSGAGRAPGTSSAGVADRTVTLLEQFLGDLQPEQHQLLLLQLDRVFRSWERADLADQLRDQGDELPQASEDARGRHSVDDWGTG
jgi:hypothetical protein